MLSLFLLVFLSFVCWCYLWDFLIHDFLIPCRPFFLFFLWLGYMALMKAFSGKHVDFFFIFLFPWGSRRARRCHRDFGQQTAGKCCCCFLSFNRHCASFLHPSSLPSTFIHLFKLLFSLISLFSLPLSHILLFRFFFLLSSVCEEL